MFCGFKPFALLILPVLFSGCMYIPVGSRIIDRTVTKSSSIERDKLKSIELAPADSKAGIIRLTATETREQTYVDRYYGTEKAIQHRLVLGFFPGFGVSRFSDNKQDPYSKEVMEVNYAAYLMLGVLVTPFNLLVEWTNSYENPKSSDLDRPLLGYLKMSHAQTIPVDNSESRSETVSRTSTGKTIKAFYMGKPVASVQTGSDGTAVFNTNEWPIRTSAPLPVTFRIEGEGHSTEIKIILLDKFVGSSFSVDKL